MDDSDKTQAVVLFVTIQIFDIGCCKVLEMEKNQVYFQSGTFLSATFMHLY